MSVVVAIKENGKVFVGADSQVTSGGTRETLRNSNNIKIWNVKNAEHCLMAHVGVVRDANVVRLMDNLVTEYNVFKNQIDYEFVVKSVVPDIISELKKYGYLKDEQYFEHMESRFIFAYKDQLFVIHTDGCVIEVDDYAAIGSGQDQAIGSLLSTDGDDAQTRIIKAIKASAASDIYVDYPIVLANTEDNDFKIVMEKDEKAFLNTQKGKKYEK